MRDICWTQIVIDVNMEIFKEGDRAKEEEPPEEQTAQRADKANGGMQISHRRTYMYAGNSYKQSHRSNKGVDKANRRRRKPSKQQRTQTTIGELIRMHLTTITCMRATATTANRAIRGSRLHNRELSEAKPIYICINSYRIGCYIASRRALNLCDLR